MTDPQQERTVHRAVLVEDLKRTQIVQYAGASGDFNPLHTDATYAVGFAGYRDVFAHGMLTAGLAGRFVREIVPDEQLVHFGGRFRAQVWPGDTLSVAATVERDGACTKVRLEVSNQAGSVVFSGQATFRRRQG